MTNANLYAIAELARYYRSSKDKKLHLSKQPIAKVVGDCDYCREALCRNFEEAMFAARQRDGKAAHYYLIPQIKVIPKNEIEQYPTSSLVLEVGEVAERDIWEKMDNPKECNKFIQLTDYTLGVLNVLIATDPLEVERMRALPRRLVEPSWSRTQKDFQAKLVFTYNRLSPWWTVSPITVSFVFLVYRAVLTAMDMHPTLVNKFLASESHENIKRILNTMDKQKAMRFYKKSLLPFLLHCGHEDNYFPDHSETIERQFFNGNIYKLFNPKALVNHWTDIGDYDIYNDGCYGVSSFLHDVESEGEEERYDEEYGDDIQVIPVLEEIKRRNRV